jgi:guanylate kinase
MRNNLSLVITAPSGAGKTTMIRALLSESGEIEFSISSTTRAMREGETNGVDYYFISKEAFISGINNNEFVEWAEVHGNFYGTMKKEIDRIHDAEKIPLFDVDVQGSKSLREKLEDAVFILIVPPSLKILEERLKTRNTESAEQIQLRLTNAACEMSQYSLFDYVLVNDDLTQSMLNFKSIIRAELNKTKRQIAVIEQILEA